MFLSLSPGEETAVWQCLTFLEEGLSHSPSNAQFKLLLIRIYCRLGAFEPVAELYSSLDAKHIQHDTIGWVVYTENNWWSSPVTSPEISSVVFAYWKLADCQTVTVFCKSILEFCEIHLLWCALHTSGVSFLGDFDQFWILRILTKLETCKMCVSWCQL